jgi:hypothetical protein
MKKTEFCATLLKSCQFEINKFHCYNIFYTCIPVTLTDFQLWLF